MRAFQAQGGALDDIRDGRFVALLSAGSQTIIRTDQTGQEQLFVYRDGDAWAVSNSFLLLVAEVAAVRKLTLYKPSVVSFHLKSGRHIGEQLVSHQTAVREIKMVPALNELVLDHDTGRLNEMRRSFSQEVDFSDRSYEETLLNFLEHRAGLLAALAGTGAPLNLMLSGGYDSRLVLQLLEKSGAHRSVHVSSDQNRANDFRSACAVAGRLGLEVNKHRNRRIGRAATADAVRLWLMSCGCTYLPFYRVSSFSQEASFEFKLTGDQPSGWDHFGGRAVFNGTPQKIANDIETALQQRTYGQEVAKDFLGVFDEIDFDPNHPRAMIAHYGAIRARHHCGRNWYKALGSERFFTPLMGLEMVRLEMFSGLQGWSIVKFFADAFSALDPGIFDVPFETPERSFDPALLESSPFRGGVEIVPRKIAVFGEYFENDASLPKTMMNLPLRAKSSDQDVKSQLAHNLWTSDRIQAGDLFTSQDIEGAKQEISAEGSLSMDCRKLCHIVMTDTLMELIESSGRH